MDTARLAQYILGGRPTGALRGYPGCRDRRLPEASVPLELDGVVYFATESAVWTGGRAFYDPDARGPVSPRGAERDGGGNATQGRVLARAHLVTVGQFSDIAAQEMYRDPGADLDLTEVLSRGRAVLGEGRYETLLCLGALDGVPVVTFTAPWGVGDVEWRPPAAPYLAHLSTGLLEADVWAVPAVAAYLAACPGAAGHWTPERIARLISPERL
ncbi:histone deacetylase [Streptomyces sp. NPDC088725]|uniref:histone deacetylase n=1 Tax=Streptomyces sp. NPDC088725 TaxID=3365873 RepID=UPI0038089C2F